MLDTSGQQCPLSFFTPPEFLHSVMNGSQYISRRTAETFDWSVAAVPAKREYVLSEITANVAQRLGSNIQITGHTFLRTTLQDPSFVIKQIDELALASQVRIICFLSASRLQALS